MSGGFIADSSVTLAWVAQSQFTKATDHLLDEVASGTPFTVPVLWMFEVANSLLVLKRRKRISLGECSLATRILSRLNPIIDDEGPRLALHKITELAEGHGLSIYDATYLELAIRKRLSIASRNADLNRAASRVGIRTLV